MAEPDIAALQKRLAPARAAVVGHPVYAKLTTLPAVRVFMRHHVFAVLDFMALLKSLQRDLTCVNVAWRPVGDPLVRRMINAIVLAEESDELADGTLGSHFELYLAAMERAGADPEPARKLCQRMAEGHLPGIAIGGCGAPAAAERFTRTTWNVLAEPLYVRAAVFAFSREEIIPDMFAQAIGRLDAPELSIFRAYLARHIELDLDEHGPLALRMVEQVCGSSTARWQAAAVAAEIALEARRQLWDDVAALIPG